MPCIYCGGEDNLTKDHVPPKALLLRPYPSDLWTVPACQVCNNKYSLEEEYFRLVIVGLLCHTPEAETLFNDRISRSMDRRAALEESMFGCLGVAEGAAYVSMDYARVHQVAEKIVRGLKYALTGVAFPPAQTFTSFFYEVEEGSEIATFGPAFTFQMRGSEGLSWEFTLFDSIRFQVMALDDVVSEL